MLKGLLSQLKHYLFTAPHFSHLLIFVLLASAMCYGLGVLRYRLPQLADFIFVSIATAYLYIVWPHVFFDDAGFILRYLDNLQGGFWFQFNAGEGAVFGISGFLHGLFCSVAVVLGMGSESALHLSNIVGLASVIFFLSRIFLYFLHRPVLAYGVTLVTVCFTKNWVDVLFTGMEMPMHLAFIFGAFYFLLYERSRLFYLFAALSVISKLDAVPVICVLLSIHAINNWNRFGLLATIKSEWKNWLVFFGLPELAWIVFSIWFFGSPFPQSAKAKVLYHSGVHDSFFPFMDGFTKDVFKLPMLYLYAILFVVHLLYTKKKGIVAITTYFAFGWMFFGIMLLYYFYNPNERMLWYYSLPDILLVSQCILSSVWLATQAKDWKKYVLPLFTILCWVMYLKPDTDGARQWLVPYMDRVERERYEIGKYIAKEASSGDTLVAWHGLIGRPFPGYVLDGTGLNSKLAVDYKLDISAMLDGLKPDKGIHQGTQGINESFTQNNYKIEGMFGDITLAGQLPWILWTKENSDGAIQTKVITMKKTFVQADLFIQDSLPLKLEGANIIFRIPPDVGRGKWWGIFERTTHDEEKIHVKVWNGTILASETDITLPPFGNTDYPSLYSYGESVKYTPIDSTKNTRIEFSATGNNSTVKITNPLIEYEIHQP
jgi:hypothetical protein